MHSTLQIRCSQKYNTLLPFISRYKRTAHNDSFLNRTSLLYLENLYNTWVVEPKIIDSSWQAYFTTIAQQNSTNYHENKPSRRTLSTSTTQFSPKEGSPQAETTGWQKTIDVNNLVLAYQNRGHLIADTDPLGIQNPTSHELQGTTNLPPDIVVRRLGKDLMTPEVLDTEFPLVTTFIGGSKKSLPLREIITKLNKIYCGHLGLEYNYIHNKNMIDWLRHKFEVDGAWELSEDHRRWTWKYILRAATFESFLAKKYGPEKRFGLEGCDALIPSILQCLETSSEKGIDSVVIGMAHRGRLNTLANICLKPLNQLFTQFNPITLTGLGSGDVKYHLGTYAQRLLERSGKTVNIAILANPSHLESVDPLIVGRVRAEQVEKNDTAGNNSLALLVHGDAALSGQGICYETLHLTNLRDYTTGGVIHTVINNQIGFTTDPRFSRSSVHCTDIARVVNAPIFHINADDPDLVTYCSKVAAEYRSEFHNDVVLDIVGYRRNGHNEMDEPMLTQPLMYKRIKQHPSVLTIYSNKLLKEGIITENDLKTETEKFLEYCETEFNAAQSVKTMEIKDWYDIPYSDFFSKQSPKNKIPPTGIPMEDIKKICSAFSTPPKEIQPHNQVLRVMLRRKQLAKARLFDWAMCEALAFLSLLKDGHHVRLSGEDVERGTFSHRIHIIHDQERDKTYANILKDVFPGQALYTVSNSSLSEYGVLDVVKVFKEDISGLSGVL